MAGILFALLAAVWFFRTARSRQENGWVAFAIGFVTGYGGAFFGAKFFEPEKLFASVEGMAHVLIVLAFSLVLGAIFATTVRATLYSGTRKGGDIATAGLLIFASYAFPLVFSG